MLRFSVVQYECGRQSTTVVRQIGPGVQAYIRRPAEHGHTGKLSQIRPGHSAGRVRAHHGGGPLPLRYRTSDGVEFTDLVEINTLELAKLPREADQTEL